MSWVIVFDLNILIEKYIKKLNKITTQVIQWTPCEKCMATKCWKIEDSGPARYTQIIIMSVNKFILISSIQAWRNFTELSNDKLEHLDRPSESDKYVYKLFHNKGLQNFWFVKTLHN